MAGNGFSSRRRATQGQYDLGSFRHSVDLGCLQLLAANLEEADPVVYEILQKVCLT